MRSTIDLEGLARGIDAGFPRLGPSERRMALAVHRLMAEGRPVAPGDVAAQANVSLEAVEEALRSWPGVFLDDAGRVVGFWGLALGEMPHRFTVDDHLLYTWCAWDSLFLPEILGRPADVESSCPASGRDVSLRAGPEGVEDLRPDGAVVSMLDVSAWRGVEGNQVISSCCHHINFFATRGHAEAWRDAQDRDDVLILDVHEAHELGRLANRLRYGDALTLEPGLSEA